MIVMEGAGGRQLAMGFFSRIYKTFLKEHCGKRRKISG
jgi:hypothetical protein